MDTVLAVFLFTVAFFLAVIVLLASRSTTASRVTGISMLLAGVGGLMVYSYGYAYQSEFPPLTVLRTILAVFRMFLGENDFSEVAAAPLFATSFGELVFWAVHFLAMYATAGAIFLVVGDRVIRWFRLHFSFGKDLILIYGVHEDSIAFGKSLASKETGTVIFVDDVTESSLVESVSATGAVLCRDTNAVEPDGRFLRGVGMKKGKRNLKVYALHRDAAKNLTYATGLLQALKDEEIEPERTKLVMFASEEGVGGTLQAFDGQYGYGNVTVFDEFILAARLLMQKYPPCDTLSFHGDGRAAEDFEALVVGFGRMGQSVMRHLVMNGQFEGSTFRLAIFDPNCDALKGCLAGCSSGLEEDYHISFHPHDARGLEMYRYLVQRSGSLKYVVVCAGSPERNQEIADELSRHLSRLNSSAAVYQCSHQGVRYQSSPARPPVLHGLYDPEILLTDRMDRMAIALNQSYSSYNGLSAAENWRQCDYFSRMSSRASTDFIPALLRSVGKTERQAMEEDWVLSEEQLENLGRTEHLRWCAFHHVMGIEKMDEETFRCRCAIHREERERTGSSKFRISKNLAQHQHACLIPWEELDALSAAENAVTGKNVDYKATDKNNVLAVPDVLRAGYREA